MIIRSGVSGRNRTDRGRPEPTRTDRVPEYRCRHGFVTPTRTVWIFGVETEIPGDGRCTDPH
jgi:hypothetical protein